MNTAGFLSWIPFIEPINALQSVWYLLLIPFAFGVSVIYKAYHLRDLTRYWREVLAMTSQVVIALIALGILLAVLVETLIPLIPVVR